MDKLEIIVLLKDITKLSNATEMSLMIESLIKIIHLETMSIDQQAVSSIWDKLTTACSGR